MRPSDGRAVPTFLRQALADAPLTMYGDGGQTRSFCYVDDLLEGLVRLADAPYHQPVNLRNPAELTVLELAQTVVAMTGSASPIVFEALPQDDPTVRRPDISLARDLLGWSPAVSLHEGLIATLGGRTRGPEWSRGDVPGVVRAASG